MGIRVFYCEYCSRRIAPEEIENNDIVRTERGYICATCAPKLNLLTLRQEQKNSLRNHSGERKRESRITTYSIREANVDEYELYGLDREIARPVPHPVPKKSNTPLLLGVIGAIAVVIIVIAAASGSGERPPTNPYAYEESTTHSPGDTGNTQMPDTTTGQDERRPSIFKNPWEEERPFSTPDYGEGEEEQPVSRPWLEEFQRAIEFKRNNPNDYRGVKQRLTSIMQKYEDKMGWDERDRILTELDRWDEEWRKRAEKAFRNALQKEKEAETLDEKIRVWKEFPERFLNVGGMKERVEEALQLFNAVKEAITSFDETLKRVEEALKNEDYMEAGYILNEWREEYVEPFEGTEDEERIKAMLSEQLEKFEQMRQRIDKEFEDYLAKQREDEKEQPEQQPQPQPMGKTSWSDWKAYKRLLEQVFSAVDSNPQNTELRPGSSALVNRVNRLGAGTDFDGRTLVNRGSADGGIIPSFKKMYLWETYTFTLKIKVINGIVRIGLRLNAVKSGGLTGATGSLQATGRWVELKVEVGKTSADVYVNGQRHSTLRLSEDRNPPTGFPGIILPPNGKVEIESWRIELKTIRK